MKPVKRKVIEVLVFILSLAFFLLSLAKSINVYDFFTYAADLEKGFGKNDLFYPLFHSFGPYGGGAVENAFSRTSMYVFTSSVFVWVFSHVAGFGIESVLNAFSAVLTAASSVFVYKTAGLFFDRNRSLVATALYVFMPYVFFNGINASTWALQLLFTSAWLYFLLSGIKKRDEKNGIFATLALLANIFTYLSSTTLIIAHVYGLTRIKKKPSWIMKNLLLLVPAVPLIYYFINVHPVYPVGLNPLRYIFMTALLVWESANALSLGFFIAVAAAMAHSIKKLRSRKFEDLDMLFWMSFLPAFSGLTIFVYNPVFIFNSLFVFLPAMFLTNVKFSANFKKTVAIIIVLMLVKDVPIYQNFHAHESPHKQFALWLADNVEPDSVVVVGHECPAAMYYTNLTIVCRGDITNITAEKIYVTSQYFKNENQKELEFMNNYTSNLLGFQLFKPIESYISRYDLLEGRKFEKFKEYDGDTRKMEDSFELFFSFYPNPFTNLIINTEFIKDRYELFRVA